MAAILIRINEGTVSNHAAKTVLDSIWSAPPGAADLDQALHSIDQVIEAKGLKQINDSGALKAIIAQVLANNPDNVTQFKAGKEKAFNALVGQVMKASQGKANPKEVNDLLKSALSD
jgi:aspartyl-tRNA(Asn)/glutamyl-tRNA(Gln) amidotransferase subunit B